MKKTIIIDCAILFFILTTVVFAKTYVVHEVDSVKNSSTIFWYNDLNDVSKSLQGNTTNETINNIMFYVQENMNYKFYWHKQPLKQIWISMEGDCTDSSTLIKYMLKENNIKTYYVHGYCYVEEEKYKHDWLEYKGNTIDIHYCDKLVKHGRGIW